MKINKKPEGNRKRKVVVYGTPGIGKSTFASKFGRVLAVDIESGLNDIEVDRTDRVTSIEQFKALINEMIDDGLEGYDYVVIDTIDWLERIIHSELCSRYGKDAISEISGGYGKGENMACREFSILLKGVDFLADTLNIGVVLVAHSRVERFEDPAAGPYDRYVPKLDRRAKEVMIEWADEVLFAHSKTVVKKEGESFGRDVQRAISNGERVLLTSRTPFADGKNRLSMSQFVPMNEDTIKDYFLK